MIQNDAWMRAGCSVHITRPSITITCERSPSPFTPHTHGLFSPSGHQPRQIVSHRRTFPPKFRNQFSAARDSSPQSVLGATLPRFPAMNMEMWPGCRHQQQLRGARGGGGLPGHHGPTAAGRGTTTGLPQHSATLTLMFLEIHNVRISS